jgi:hypothetical protein
VLPCFHSCHLHLSQPKLLLLLLLLLLQVEVLGANIAANTSREQMSCTIVCQLHTF